MAYQLLVPRAYQLRPEDREEAGLRKSFIALWSSWNYLLLESTRELIKNIFALKCKYVKSLQGHNRSDIVVVDSFACL